MARTYTFDRACREFVNRYTLEHVPSWARGGHAHESLGVVYYAPQYRSDREWYDSSSFPGEGGIPARATYMESGPATWPLGHGFLVSPYAVGHPAPALAGPKPDPDTPVPSPLGDKRPNVSTILERAEAFIAGFEDDDSQEGVAALLDDIRAALGKGDSA